MVRFDVGALCAFLVLAVAGCSSDEDEAKKSEARFTLHRTVTDETAHVVAGVNVCADSHPDYGCALTDDLGIAELGLPPDTDVKVSYQKDGHVPKLHQMRTGAAGETTKGLGGWILQTRQWYVNSTAALGGTLDLETKTILGLQAELGTPVEFGYSPEDPNDIGPFWFRLNGNVLEACVVKPECDTAVWAFADVTPGNYKGFGTAGGKSCTPKAFPSPCSDGTAGCNEIEGRAGWVVHSGWSCQ